MMLLLTAVSFFAWAYIARKATQIMATFQDVKDMLAKVQAGVDGLEASIKDLKAQVAAGSVITQSQLDELAADAAAVSADIADTSDQG